MADRSILMDQSNLLNRNYLPWPPPRLPHAPESHHHFYSANPKRPNWKPKKAYQTQRRFFQKKRRGGSHDFTPFTPHNTTSFLIRAKKSGGIASMTSPCPVTPSVLPTPKFSPSHEVLADEAKEEWGVDGYGSMNGLIRLRSPEPEPEEEESMDSSESDVDEVERRLDHDLSRFEMIYDPQNRSSTKDRNVLESRVDDQDEHIDILEEENLMLKERLFAMERELEALRRRVKCLEGENGSTSSDGEDICSERSTP